MAHSRSDRGEECSFSPNAQPRNATPKAGTACALARDHQPKEHGLRSLKRGTDRVELGDAAPGLAVDFAQRDEANVAGGLARERDALFGSVAVERAGRDCGAPIGSVA